LTGVDFYATFAAKLNAKNMNRNYLPLAGALSLSVMLLLTVSCGGGTRPNNQSAQTDNHSDSATSRAEIPQSLVGKWCGEGGVFVMFEITAEGLYISHNEQHTIEVKGDSLMIFKEDGSVYTKTRFEIKGNVLIQYSMAFWGIAADHYPKWDNSTKEGYVYLKYNQPVNGYRVEAFFEPNEELLGHVAGFGQLTFTDSKGRQFRISSLYFAIPRQHFSDVVEDWDEFASSDDNEKFASIAKGQTYHLDYIFPNIDKNEPFALHDEMPFYFEDVLFSGTPQLIITHFGRGQRFYADYSIYTIVPNGLSAAEKDIPFRLDGLSMIDGKNKQITVQKSQDADDSFEEVYKINEQGDFYLFKTIRE
jgi:hypothetical protein